MSLVTTFFESCWLEYIDRWNRIVVEISQGQPHELGVGFSAARAWVNQIGTSKVYFGDFGAEKFTILDENNAALEICGAFDSISPNKVSQTWLGYYDVLNFVWFQGSQYLFQNTSGK